MLKKFKEHVKQCKGDGFVEYMWSDRVIKRGPQIFAIFGDIAYDVSKIKFYNPEDSPEIEPGSGKLCVPIKGRYLAEFPDEGRSGVLGCYIINKKGRRKYPIYPSFVFCGWLYADELELSNDEIRNNIVEDIKQGKNILTNKPAGWV